MRHDQAAALRHEQQPISEILFVGQRKRKKRKRIGLEHPARDVIAHVVKRWFGSDISGLPMRGHVEYRGEEGLGPTTLWIFDQGLSGLIEIKATPLRDPVADMRRVVATAYGVP